jgi:hypothetical protein
MCYDYEGEMERYMYRVPDWNGEFRNIRVGWEEYQNQIKKFSFVEEMRAFDSITLFDATRNIRVLIPLGGGQAFFRVGPGSWTPLVNVERIGRTFTSAQRTILTQDWQAARKKLDRVIGRLAEPLLGQTPSLHDMHRKVKNIFHIDVANPDLGVRLVDGLHFAALLANFKTLRDAGFNAEPPFLLESDTIKNENAWVVGVDDPTIHIAPHHFFMDREPSIFTLVHERAHTVLRLQGHPGGVQQLIDPAEGVPTMTRDDAVRNAYCYEWLTIALQN